MEMSLSLFSWNIIFAVWFALISEKKSTAQDVCAKFNISGPCQMLPSYTQQEIGVTAKPIEAENPYCTLACSQENAENFREFCACAAAIAALKTTPFLMKSTTMSTTTPRPATCYYSSRRAARLDSVSRRLYSSVTAIPQCQYPGIVGLFYELKGEMKQACMASLLSEKVILINENFCLNYVKRFVVYVLVGSYRIVDVSKTISLKPDTIQKLDPDGVVGGLYTVELSTNLTLTGDCIQPVCVPNVNINAADLDFTDCRIVGYGSTVDSFTVEQPSELREIKVTVNPSSIKNGNLTVERADNIKGTVCMGDDASPLICSLHFTREWVTVGIVTRVGNPCSNSLQQAPVIANLLQESKNKAYFKGLQQYSYVDPNVFKTLQ